MMILMQTARGLSDVRFFTVFHCFPITCVTFPITCVTFSITFPIILSLFPSFSLRRVHNDLHQHAGGGRRLAVVSQMSSADWTAGCGGALVWCDPVEVIEPGFNSLTLFATDHWSWHFVEPVWETDVSRHALSHPISTDLLFVISARIQDLEEGDLYLSRS